MKKSVFDFAVTNKELSYLKILSTKENYLNTSSDMKRMYDLYILFVLRGNDEESTKIMNDINMQVINPSLN